MKKELLERLKAEYPKGTRVILEHMDDITAPPVGTLGTVYRVDATGSLIVNWANGSGLNVLYGVDRVKRCPSNDELKPEAIKYAESIGISEFKVNTPFIEYWSFFNGEGFYFIQHNLMDDTETRHLAIPWNGIVPAFLEGENGKKYNYNCG